MDVRAIPGQEHLPWAEVWFHEADEERWREASRRARELGKSGLEVWTTKPEVAAWFEERGYEEVRRYLLFELELASAPDPGDPEWPLVTLAERPDLVEDVWAIARETHVEQPGREDAVLDHDGWIGYAVERNPKDAFFVALAEGRPVGFGVLSVEGDSALHAMTAVARDWRRRGIAESIKRAHIRWAKAQGLRRLWTANEVRIPAIRRLNERYGYRPLPPEIVLRGPLAPSL